MRRLGLTLCGLLASLGAAAAPPELQHTPPEARAGHELVFRAAIRAPGGVYNPELLWRPAGGQRWRRVPMRAEGDAWVATLPAAELPAAGLDYFLQAYEKTTLDEGSWRSPQDPQHLAVAASPPQPQVEAPPPVRAPADAPAAASAPPASRRGPLFLRAQLDAGLLLFSGKLLANADFNSDIDLTATGAAAGFGLAVGGFLRHDLALSASFWNAYSATITLSPTPPESQDAKQSLIALGPQLTWYPGESDLSISAMAGVCATYLHSDANEVHLNALLGLGARASLNKEWPISESWALGIGGQVSYAFAPGGEAGRPQNLSTFIIGGALTATHR